MTSLNLWSTLGDTMVNQGEDVKFNLQLLRGWQRSQLKLLKEFTIRDIVPQTKLSLVSGSPEGSRELGGKLTALTRSELIVKAGKDNKGSWVWQLNEEKVEKETLKDFLEKLGI